MANSDLPQEILIEIFSRLPAKSVGKCRCLAKTWRTLLSTPQFIKSHLLRKPYQQNLILVDPSGFVYSSAAAEGAVSRKLQAPHYFTGVVRSCDGLVLLRVFPHRKFLVNPITLQRMEITDSPLALPKDECFSAYGLGYDRISDDYKIVVLSYRDTHNEQNPDDTDAFVDVYSVRNCGWKRVDNSPYNHALLHLSCGAFVNGAIHWIGCSGEEGLPPVIAAFDLADEMFGEMPAPSDVGLAKFMFCKLLVLGGCLCVVHARICRSDVWVMKEYGVGKSWTKFSIEGVREFGIVNPLCFYGDDEEEILVVGRKSLAVYNVKEKAFRDIALGGVPALFEGVGAFVESLVSPALLEEGVKAEAQPEI